MSIRVAITDDHPLAINGLRNMLSNADNIVVLDCYETGQELLNGIKLRQPDILLLDIQLPDYKGNELAEMISKVYPWVKIIAISSLDAPIHVKMMMRSGCSGYVLKNTRVKALLHAIEQVHSGIDYIEQALKEQMMQHLLKYKKLNTSKTPTLTQREKEILKLIVEENTNQEIAEKLFLSLRTVENHRFSLLQKLDVKNAIGLVKVAIQSGLVE